MDYSPRGKRLSFWEEEESKTQRQLAGRDGGGGEGTGVHVALILGDSLNTPYIPRRAQDDLGLD